MADDLKKEIQTEWNRNYGRQQEQAEAVLNVCSRWLNGWESAMTDHHLNPDFRVPG
jgi:hypothetical protein